MITDLFNMMALDTHIVSILATGERLKSNFVYAININRNKSN